MKRIIINILLIIIPSFVFSQVPNMAQTMLSPNAASLGEYGEVPVSPFTGIPQIEIPLYEVKVDNYKLPLVMSYHAGGVRPDQHPGWTGLGWTLMAGGCISRVVNDKIDEYHNVDNKSGMPIYEHMGFLYVHNLLNQLQWNDKTYMRSFLFQLAVPGNSEYDTEPDRFSFNFCGYSGNFYLNHKGEWQVQCDKPLKVIFEDTPENFTLLYGKESSSFSTTGTDITYDGCGASHSFKKFTIIAEDGTQYIFGDDDNAIEYSVPFFEQKKKRLQATTWNLTKIILPNNRIIKFTYERGDFLAQMFLSVSSTINYKIVADDGSIVTSGCSSSDMPSINTGNNGQLILPSYLRYIEGGNTRVEFYRKQSTELKYDFWNLCMYNQHEYIDKLDEFLPILQYNGNYEGDVNYPNCLNGIKYYQLYAIMVKDSGSDYRYTYAFHYSKNLQTRLMLDSIVESNYSVTGRAYRFEYDRANLLPGYVSNQTDHWGFYNNNYAYYDNLESYSSYREPNTTVATYGTLTKITYPTGGYTRFLFEPNDYGKSISEDRTECHTLGYNRKAGGIRIREIKNSPTGKEEDEYSSRRYYYVTDYLQNKGNSSNSSGVLGALAKYRFDYTAYSILGGFRTKMELFSSQSVLPGTVNACGSHVGYSEVIEKYSDGSFSRYKYTNFDDRHFDEPCDMNIQLTHVLYEPYSSREQERGLLKTKEDYDSNSKLKHSIDYEYEKDMPDSCYVRAIKASYTPPPCYQVGEGYLEGSIYRYYTYLMRKVKETEKRYDSSTTPLTETCTYGYNEHNMITNIRRTLNDGNVQIIKNKYPGYNGNYPSSDMVKGNVLSSLMETSESVLINNIEYPVFKTMYNYTKKGEHNFTISAIYEAKGSNGYEPKISYLYDAWNNPKVISPLTGVQTVYIWGLKHEYLLAEIKNSYTMTVEQYIGSIEAFGETLTPDYDKLDNLRTQLLEAEITTYKYKPLIGLIQSTDPRGIKRFYEYDSMHRLSVIKDASGNIIEMYKYNYKK